MMLSILSRQLTLPLRSLAEPELPLQFAATWPLGPEDRRAEPEGFARSAARTERSEGARGTAHHSQGQ